MSLHTFVIEDGACRIVVDTCVGISKDHPQIPEFDTSIDRSRRPCCSGLRPPDAVDTVVCTHLHVDHVGWNTLPDQPRHDSFPNRRVVLRVSRHVTRQKPLDTKPSHPP
jgi:glyoxylase-like metal-dependent hydrolase (beta-lactamase superfamily II)